MGRLRGFVTIIFQKLGYISQAYPNVLDVGTGEKSSWDINILAIVDLNMTH